MQHTWLGSRSRHNLKTGSSVDVKSDRVFTTYQANVNLQPAYQKQFMDDAANLPFVMRQQLAAFNLSRKVLRLNFEHKLQEREALNICWGVDANDLEFITPSIFPAVEVTNNYQPGYGPPLGEDWPSSDDEQTEVIAPETTEKFLSINQALPTTSILSDLSERTRFPHDPRRSSRREASTRIFLEKSRVIFHFSFQIL